jgi:predicted ribosome quality control (RQC) complex YloA/Tae2 family protein
VGTIDVGKDADLAIYNHDPLSAYAVVQKTIIDGRVYFDRKRDIAERAEREKEKKALNDKLKKAAEKKPEEKKLEEKKPEAQPQKPAEKKPEETKPEEIPKPPQDGVSNDGARLSASSTDFGGVL